MSERSTSGLRRRLGVVLPQHDLDPNPRAITRFAEGVEDLGLDHLLAYDHVLGGSREGREGWSPAYTSEHVFHELFVLFGYLAAVTSRVRLISGVIILPQRQTVLAAKQAAEVNLLSGGRFDFGVGIGWNDIEYQGLNENFRNRGKRLEEQIDVMRRLWAHDTITYNGAWHTIDRAGINPRPASGTIPVWVGGSAEPAARRAGRLGDGFYCNQRLGPQVEQTLRWVREGVEARNGDWNAFGIDARIAVTTHDPDQWRRDAEAWLALGATQLSLVTMRGEFASLDAHLERIETAAHAIMPLLSRG